MKLGRLTIPEPANLPQAPVAPELKAFLEGMTAMDVDEDIVVDAIAQDPEALKIIRSEIG